MKRILITGDLFPSKNNESRFVEGDIQTLFGSSIVSLFQRADVSVCNLEGALTTHNETTVKLGPNIKARPETLLAYKKLGIKLFATANNHVNDYCQKGYLDTKEALDREGFQYVGSGVNMSDVRKSVSFDLDGCRLCIYNVAETMFNAPTATSAGVNLYDEYLVCRELEQLKQSNDVVVVLYHGGIEYFPYPTLELRKRFHRMADSGADVILAQHTHCIGCEETYKGAYLLYGQGNFLFDRPSVNACMREGLAIELELEGKSVAGIKKHLVKVNDGCMTYVESPDFSQFDERGSHIQDDDYLIGKFKDFVMTQKHIKTKQFVVDHWYDSILKSLMSKKKYARYKEVHFTKPQLMRILYTLISEQQRETALYMTLRELEKK